jgi:hypothetical protein
MIELKLSTIRKFAVSIFGAFYGGTKQQLVPVRVL